jgi:hypothetical protein
MEDTHHLKMKLGPHEFEASGSAESVREQFQAFKEMVAAIGSAPQPPSTPAPAIPSVNEPDYPNKMFEFAEKSAVAVDTALPQITRIDGRSVSLTARPNQISDGILVIMYGQKILRQNDGVTGAEIIQGLRTTGGYSFDRVDRVLDGIAREGNIIAFGEHRGKRYRLSNTGMIRARAIATELILSVGGTL